MGLTTSSWKNDNVEKTKVRIDNNCCEVTQGHTEKAAVLKKEKLCVDKHNLFEAIQDRQQP
jgi:hypothetical protein